MGEVSEDGFGDSVSSGERTRKSLNLPHAQDCPRCVEGVAGRPVHGGQPVAEVTKIGSSRTALERATREGDSPVGERVSPSGAVPK